MPQPTCKFKENLPSANGDEVLLNSIFIQTETRINTFDVIIIIQHAINFSEIVNNVYQDSLMVSCGFSVSLVGLESLEESVDFNLDLQENVRIKLLTATKVSSIRNPLNQAG